MQESRFATAKSSPARREEKLRRIMELLSEFTEDELIGLIEMWSIEAAQLDYSANGQDDPVQEAAAVGSGGAS